MGAARPRMQQPLLDQSRGELSCCWTTPVQMMDIGAPRPWSLKPESVRLGPLHAWGSDWDRWGQGLQDAGLDDSGRYSTAQNGAGLFESDPGWSRLKA